MKRLTTEKQKKIKLQAESSTDLTGRQIFIRSCNTCHPQGQSGVGAALNEVNVHFKNNDELKQLIRSGRGIMPGQTDNVLNEKEIDNLILYIRSFNQ